MEVRRVFVDRPELKNGMLFLAGPVYKYIVTVLRKGTGDRIDVIDGTGRSFHCVVEDIRTKEVSLRVLDVVQKPEEKRSGVTLCVSPIKGPRMDWLVEKATELGAERIVPTIFQRTVIKLNGKEESKTDRWERIAIEASRQSGRFSVPEVTAPTPLRSVLPFLEKIKNRIVLYEKERERTIGDYFVSPPEGPICVVIGPEGGIESSEMAWLAEVGFTSCTLGEQILRSETTPLVILSIILHEYGRRR